MSDENGRAADEAAVGEVLIAVDGLELPVRRNHSLKLNGELLLAVDRGNSARRFYERLGFRQL